MWSCVVACINKKTELQCHGSTSRSDSVPVVMNSEHYNMLFVASPVEFLCYVVLRKIRREETCFLYKCTSNCVSMVGSYD